MASSLSSISSSSSSSISQSTKTYDVFISFRGSDVRNDLLSYLQDALKRKEIKAFVDDNLKRGEEITESLMKTIEDSYVSLVIFSENYAKSPWCLDELVKILECKNTMGQIVIPVFYQFDPTHVQKLTGNYGDALNEHRKEFVEAMVDGWSQALKEISQLSGLDSKNTRKAAEFVDEIVSKTLEELNGMASNISFQEELNSLESRVNSVESLLSLGPSNVRIVGILGKAGIGKSFIAKKVYDHIKDKFKCHRFVEKISERLEKGTLNNVLNEIVCATLGQDFSNEGNNITLSPSTAKMLARRKVFIVLDGVSDLKQIEFFTGRNDIFGAGSRIIISSRNEQLLRNVNAEIFEVKPLDDTEALSLFCLHAFKQTTPKPGYKALANKVVKITRGNPSALKYIASELYSKSVEECEEKLKKFKGKSGYNAVKVTRKSEAGSEEQLKMMLTKFGGPKLTATLDVLWLKDCKGCENIPPLERLNCLGELYFDNLIDLEYVDFARDNGDGPFFPSLKKVWIWNCPNFRGWRKQVSEDDEDADEDDNEAPWFPCLSLLEIKNCPRLSWMPLFSSVDDRLYYVNSGCQPLQQTMKTKKILKVKELWISDLSDLEYIDADEDYYLSAGSEAKKVFPVLKKLWIYNCQNLKGWWKREKNTTLPAPGQLPQFPCLYLMEIKHCPKLSWMPLFPLLDQRLYYVKTGIQPLMQTLAISSFSNLEELWLSELSDFRHIHGGQGGSSPSAAATTTTAFLSLKKLWISYCPNFEGWWRKRDDVGAAATMTFHCLSLLEIKHCPNLSCVPLFPSLNERLYYVNVGIEPLLETMKLKTSTGSAFTNLKELWLSELTDLEYVESEVQEESTTKVLPSLNKLWISYCPNLKGWWKKSEDDETTVAQLPEFPCLTTFDIKECPQLNYIG